MWLPKLIQQSPPNAVGSLGSIQNFEGYLGGSFAPIATGYVVDQTGSFFMDLMIGAVIALGASFVYLILVRKPLEQDA